MKTSFAYAFLLLLIVACAPAQTPEKPTLSVETSEGNVEIEVEVVSAYEGRMRGLMFREHLDENEGMWFVFEESAPRSFWMKNTLIPLDMVFVDEDLVIIDILKADPCQGDPCAIYTSQADAQYVLEVNQNATDRKGIRIWDRVKTQ